MVVRTREMAVEAVKWTGMNVIRLKPRNVLEICDACGYRHVTSVMEMNYACCDPLVGRCPRCGRKLRKVYNGNYLGGQEGREDEMR